MGSEDAPSTFVTGDLIAAGKIAIGDGYRAKNVELSSDGVPFARAGNIDGGFDFSNADHFPCDNLAKVGDKVSKPGDVVLTSKGTVGRLAYVNETTPQFVYAPQLCFWRSLDHDYINPLWLYYWMSASEFRRQMLSVKGQTDMADYVSLSDQRRMEITLPLIGIQRCIAAVLGALDDKIEQNRRTGRALEALARATFKAWFVDFEPVKAKAAGQTSFPGMPPATFAALPDRFVDSELGPVPEGWEVVPLDAATTTLETGKRPKGGVAAYSSGVPSIGAESITRIGEYDFGKTKYVPEAFFAAMNKGILTDGDVLLYKDGGRPGDFQPHVSMVGKGFPFNRMSINEHVFRIRGRHPLTQNYLYLWLSSDPTMEEMRRRGTGVAIPGLSAVAAKQLPTLLPKGPVLKVFESIAEPLLSHCLVQAVESAKLAALRDYLLPRLLSGRVRVTSDSIQTKHFQSENI